MRKNFKRYIAVFLTVVMLCTYLFGITPLTTLKVNAATTATTTDYVNLRTGAGTGYSVITTVSKGASLTLLDTSNSSWYKVQTSSGLSGYMSADYLKVNADSSSGTSSSAGVTTAYVNLRSGAGTGYSVLATISIGTNVTIYETLSGWYKVKTQSGREGYMSSDYVKVTSSAQPSTPAPSTPSTPSTPTDESKGTATVTVYLNLRSGAGTGFSVITTLAPNTKVTLLDVGNSSWYKVKTPSGNTGYLSTDYLNVSLNQEPPKPQEPEAPSAPTDETKGTATVTVYLNLRSGAGTGYSVITTLAPSTTVTLLDVSNSSWYKVKTSSGNTGYLSTDYLKVTLTQKPETPSTPAPTDETKGTAVTTDYVNLRSGAGTNYSRITTLALGAKLTLLDISNSSWYKVKTEGGNIGYVSTDYIKATIKEPEPQPVPDPSVSVNASSLSVEEAQTKEFTATVENAGSNTISATSSDESVALVSQKSVSSNVYTYSVTAKKAGTATITVKIGSASKTVAVTVTAKPEPVLTPEITLSKESYSLSKDQSFDVEVSVKNKGSNQISAVSSDTSIVAVSYKSEADGKYVYTVTAKKIGETKIKFTVGEVSKELAISVKGFAKTTTGVNFRTGKSLSSEIITTLSAGTYLTVLDVSDPEWTKVSTSGGTVGYVFTEYIVFVSGSVGSIIMSYDKATIPVGKTFYNKATGSNSSAGLIWRSDDTSIATVSNGYIYGVSKGETKIYASDISGENVAECTVTVTDPEGIRFVYSTPNIVGIGAEVKAVAITGEDREKVKFVVEYSGEKTETYEVTEFTADNKAADTDVAETKTKVWEKALTFEAAGKYKVTAYSAVNGEYTEDGKSMEIYVSESSDPKVSSYGDRRASDEIIEIIANFEGLCSVVYPDTLAYDLPTLGYGYVISVGELFYNNLTEAEAWAMLCATVNEKTYTTEVNKFAKNNNLKISQSQFDALVCFSYNVGSAYWNNLSYECDLRECMLNAIDVTTLDFTSGGYAGKLEFTASVYANVGDTSAADSFKAGTAVTVIDAYTNFTDTKNEVWYKVKIGEGEYYVRASYVTLDNRSSFTRDLSYTDGVAVGSQFLQWHMAGNVCYPGLLWRRLAEAKIFTFANYDDSSYSSPNYKKNTYGYFYPKCLADYEQ